MLQDFDDWIKLRNTIWFFRFLFFKFENNSWVENLKISKSTIFEIIEKLRSNLFFKNTKYDNSILVEIRVYCYIYEHAHGVNILICSEFFCNR